MLSKYFLYIVLFVVASVAYAQSPTPATQQQPTPEQQRQAQQMEGAALEVAQMVDRNQADKIWDGASAIAKKIVSRDAFVRGVDADRKTVGSPVTRNLALLTYSQSDGSKLPPGLFANIAFATRFANEKQPVRELISFHLDDDRVWRVTGYTLR